MTETKVRPASVSRGRYRKTQDLADAIHDIVNIQFADLSMSTRQVYYQCVSCGAVQNCESGYDKVQRLVVELRREGAIEYGRIVDRTREKHQRAGWDGPKDIMETVGVAYRRNLWVDQSTVVMVACEKQALEGIFSKAVDEYGASLWTLHGYASETFLYEWSEEIAQLNSESKTVLVKYFGDHDPSGMGIERHARKTLEAHGAEFDWTRCGLLTEDFDTFNLINVPVKHGDSRARAYLAEYGDRAAELDALPPDELRRRIEGAITDHIDAENWNRLVDVEQVERESINAVVGNWDVALRAARGAA